VNVRVMSSVCLINVNGEDQKRLQIRGIRIVSPNRRSIKA
jgi:hypothetical protein